MLPLPSVPTPNERALAGWTRERFTGLTVATITLSQPASVGVEMVWKNGSALDPNGGASGYSISGKTITLGTAAIAGDVFVCLYLARSN